VSITLKGNTLQTPTYNDKRNTREIDNFFWKLEAYFGAVSIIDEAQKVSNTSFSLKDIALVWWCCRGDNIKRGSDPSPLEMDSRGNLRSSSILRMSSTR